LRLYSYSFLPRNSFLKLLAKIFWNFSGSDGALPLSIGRPTVSDLRG
jgi:hypothetical protein